MTNVIFKRGPQANLPTTGIVDGAFYLTTDTHRLYVGQDSNLALLNQTINVINTQSELPKENGEGLNDFYFIKEGNILAFYNGTSWVQINPDTDTNTELVAATNALSRTVANNAATLKLEVKDSAGNKAVGSVKVESGSSNVTIAETTEGFSIAVAAPETVDFSIEAKDSSTTNEVDVNLLKQIGSQTATTDSTITFAGNGFVSVDYTGNKIAINGVDQTVSSVDLGFNNTGVLGLTINQNGEQISQTVAPIVKVGTKDEEYKFVNGTADLPVYTMDEIGQLLDRYEEKVNAMSYKGSITRVSELPNTAELGDVYMLSAQDDTHGAGDLFVYNGSSWDHIPAGHDTDTTYTVTVTGNGANAFELKNNKGVSTGSIAVKGSDVITANGVASGNNLTVTVSHNTVTDASPAKGSVTQSAKGELSFDVVESITRDSYGHVSAVSTKTVKVIDTDTHNNLENVVIAASADGTVSTQVSMSDGESKSDSIKFTSSSLNIVGSTTDNNAQIAINLVWEEF